MVSFLLVGYFLFSVSVHGFLLRGQSDIHRCPPAVRHRHNLLTFREKCIEIVVGKEQYWEPARHDCRTRGGDLVVIPDATTQNFIMSALRAIGYKGKKLWIGLTDQAHEHHWQWVTGVYLSHYSHWAKGQNEDNILHWSQDCVYLHYADHGLWYDNACKFLTEHFHYICQYHMLPTTTTKTTHPTTTPTTTTIKTTPSTTTTTTRRPTTTTTTTTTKATTTTTASCQDTNCQKQCPNGYSGLFVGADGCIECNCN